MPIKIASRHLNGLVVLEPDMFEDERGFFMEVLPRRPVPGPGAAGRLRPGQPFPLARGVLRGLHFQWQPPMGKLMRVTLGSAYLVAVDIRKGSPTIGQWFGIEASAANKKQVYAPAGFARGFCVLSDAAEIQYKCTGIYNHQAESGILWNDPALGISWPLQNPMLSEKDSRARTLEQWLASPESDHFVYRP